MNEESFVHRIVDAYQKARRLTVPDARIARGVSRSISGIAEDLFARYLSAKFQDGDLKFYVDQNFTFDNEENNYFGNNKKKVAFRPDIAIMKNKVVVAVFDLKMDLGWMRKLTGADVKRFDGFIEGVRKTCKAHLTHSYDKKPNLEVRFSKKLVRQFVVVSDLNMSTNRLERNVEFFNQMKFNRFCFLTTGVHPNTYDFGPKKRKEEVGINMQAFDAIVELTRSQIAEAEADC